MRGIVASVTSCIGGKEEKFALQVQPLHAHKYFAYKSLQDFDALWRAMETIVADIKSRKAAAAAASTATPAGSDTSSSAYEPSMFAKWMESFVDHYAFRSIVQQLREQEKETISTLNVFLQVVLRRVSGLYVENTILRCGCCDVARRLAFLVRNFLEFAPGTAVREDSPQHRKRQLSEVANSSSSGVSAAESAAAAAKAKAPLFPTRGAGDRSPKARKLSSMGEFCIPTIRKVGLDTPSAAVVPSRRRVFAEVDF